MLDAECVSPGISTSGFILTIRFRNAYFGDLESINPSAWPDQLSTRALYKIFNRTLHRRGIYFIPFRGSKLPRLGGFCLSNRLLYRTFILLARLFTLLMEGLKSKNARQRAECLETMGSIIEEFGITVAKQISDRDNSVRNAALNCAVQAYSSWARKCTKWLEIFPTRTCRCWRSASSVRNCVNVKSHRQNRKWTSTPLIRTRWNPLQPLARWTFWKYRTMDKATREDPSEPNRDL
ncbi:unnamed protein product [Brassicogethes aeneus]|uniref:Uncharacterized protein n=1 Tax=Brassicogethes aeneus TaxID=1431903 RepID=A0A9P0BIS2_BRAAE|nr:unnamed protein product [Brassicogethes aeneus]